MGLGGKRFRPTLLLLCGDVFGQLTELHLKMALSVEVFHNFTLVHDDIMDWASLRRGAETVHEKFGVNSAILSGDLMLIQSTQLMLEACREQGGVNDVMDLFLQVGKEVCEGQENDMLFETADGIKLDSYIGMVQQKTAVLIAFSMYAGARASGLSIGPAKALYEFGIQAGIAFQVWDDYLDVFGTAAIGKVSGGDIYNKKETHLILRLKEQMNSADREVFDEYWSGAISEDDFTGIFALLKKYRIQELTVAATQERMDHAEERLLSYFDRDQVLPLLSFTGQFIDRKF
jgi:geranylgeranyl diphosphate synthase type II